MPTLSRRKALTVLFIFGLLMIFIGPNVLPRLLGNVLTGADEGVPCDWLRRAPDLRERQSLLARTSAEPLSLRVKSVPFPTSAETTWTVKIIVINRTAGSMPILYHPDQVLIGDDPTTSGFGIIFRPGLPLQNYASRQARTSYPLEEIRLLGPRQRCTITLDFPGAAAIVDIDTVRSLTAQAYYRILQPGEHPEDDGSVEPTFLDQGLRASEKDMGVIYSEQLAIPVAPQG